MRAIASRDQGAVNRGRAAAHVDRREESLVDLAVARLTGQSDGAENLLVAAAPVGIAAVPVVGRLVTVKRYAYLDPLSQELLRSSAFSFRRPKFPMIKPLTVVYLQDKLGHLTCDFASNYPDVGDLAAPES